MAARKARIPVVLDTNVLIGYYLSRSSLSANAQIVRRWRDQRKLQLLVSNEVVDEYLEILERQFRFQIVTPRDFLATV